ncbi:MAG: hypothetical protein AAF203_04470 [Pseudomonadota bacterium]
MSKKIALAALFGALQIFGFNSHAKGSIQQDLPRGPDIEARAAACGVGDQHGEFGYPLGQTTKAGPYNGLCKDLTDAEICLALVKSEMNNRGDLGLVSSRHKPKAEYCLEHFREQLLIPPVQ